MRLSFCVTGYASCAIVLAAVVYANAQGGAIVEWQDESPDSQEQVEPVPLAPEGADTVAPQPALEPPAVVVEKAVVLHEPAKPSYASSKTPYGGVGAGIRLSFFHYNELFPREATLEFLGADSMVGIPKSTEYGVCEGIHLELTRVAADGHMLIRPYADVTLGLRHTYDGSSQAEYVFNGEDTVAMFYPIVDNKTNFYLAGGIHLGGGVLLDDKGIAVYSGLDLRWWRRGFQGTFEEYYYWANLPLGVLGYVKAGRWRLGFDASAAFMLSGWMQIEEGIGRNKLRPPAVELGFESESLERVSAKVSLPCEFMASPVLSLRLTPWFEYYHFGRSNTDTLDTYPYDSFADNRDLAPFYEPASDTYIAGLAIEFIIHRRVRSWTPGL